MPGLSELISSTLQHYAPETPEAISKHNALYNRMKSKGNVETVSGGRSIVRPIEYAANGTADWYSGYDTISTATSDVLTASEYAWKQCAGTIKFNGLEIDVQNNSKEQMRNLLTVRMEVLKMTLVNLIGAGLYADGTGSSGKQIGGLQLGVADVPTTGTVGGIDRSQGANAFFRNVSASGATLAGATLSSANINVAWNKMWISLLRGADKPDLIMCDSTHYTFYWTYLQAQQRFTDSSSMAAAGFQALKFNTADVVYDDVCPAAHSYFLNTDYIYLTTAAKRNFSPLGDRIPIDVSGGTQDATVRAVAWAGNVSFSNPKYEGVMLA